MDAEEGAIVAQGNGAAALVKSQAAQYDLLPGRVAGRGLGLADEHSAHRIVVDGHADELGSDTAVTAAGGDAEIVDEKVTPVQVLPEKDIAHGGAVVKETQGVIEPPAPQVLHSGERFQLRGRKRLLKIRIVGGGQLTGRQQSQFHFA